MTETSETQSVESLFHKFSISRALFISDSILSESQVAELVESYLQELTALNCPAEQKCCKNVALFVL